MAKAELMDVVQGAGPLLMSLRLDDALCSELVRCGVLDLGPEGLFRNQHERLQVSRVCFLLYSKRKKGF